MWWGIFITILIVDGILRLFGRLFSQVRGGIERWIGWCISRKNPDMSEETATVIARGVFALLIIVIIVVEVIS